MKEAYPPVWWANTLPLWFGTGCDVSLFVTWPWLSLGRLLPSRVCFCFTRKVDFILLLVLTLDSCPVCSDDGDDGFSLLVLTPVGLEEDGVYLVGVDDFGALAHGFYHGFYHGSYAEVFDGWGGPSLLRMMWLMAASVMVLWGRPTWSSWLLMKSVMVSGARRWRVAE